MLTNYPIPTHYNNCQYHTYQAPRHSRGVSSVPCPMHSHGHSCIWAGYIRSAVCHVLLHLPHSNLPLTPGKPHEEYQKAPWVSLSGLSFHSKSLYHPPFTIWLGATSIFHHSTPLTMPHQTVIKQQYEYPRRCTHTWAWAFLGPLHFLALDSMPQACSVPHTTA